MPSFGQFTLYDVVGSAILGNTHFSATLRQSHDSSFVSPIVQFQSTYRASRAILVWCSSTMAGCLSSFGERCG